MEDADDDLYDDDEQDLLVVLKLSNRSLGTAAERMAIEEFGEQLEAALQEAAAGEYDGDEIGGGECILFFAGPDVDRMIAVLRPLLTHSPQGRGACFVRMVPGADGQPVQQRIPV